MHFLRSRRSAGATATSSVRAELATARLSWRSITGRAVSAATAMTVVAGVVPAGTAVTGVNTFPVIFGVVAAAFALFAPGYLAASRRYATAEASGAFYNLIRHGLGRIVGVGAGWVALTAYTALTLGLYGLIGSTLTPLLEEVFGLKIPWQVVAVVAVLVVGWLGLVGIEGSTKVLRVLVTCEVAAILAVSLANWTHPAHGVNPLASLDPRQLVQAGPGVTAAQLALGVLGFIGTELTVVHTQDARDGHRGVRSATYGAIAVLAVLYVVGPSGLTVTLGQADLVAAAKADPAGVFVATARANLGPAVATIVQVLFATSVLAGAVAFHGATSMYGFFLGKGHAAPAFLKHLSTRYGSPDVASISQTVLALVAILAVSLTGADPVLVLFYAGGTAGAIGILALLVLTALATAVILLRRVPRSGGSRPTRKARERGGWAAAASVAATAVFGGLIATVLVHLDTLFGVEPDSPLPIIVQLSYCGVFAAGCAWVGWLWVFRRNVYDALGHRETVTVGGA